MRMRPSSPELRPTWWDGLAAAIVAALAIFTAVWYYGGLARSGPLTAAIVHRGQVVQTVELDRLTVHTGTITRAGQSIVCLPEQVVVQLTGGGGGGPDAVLG